MPVVEGLTVSNVGETQATIGWVVLFANDGLTSRLQYGPVGDEPTLLDAVFGTGTKEARLTNLVSNTEYVASVTATTTSGTNASGGDVRFKTRASSDTVPPVLSEIAATNVSHDSARIEWRVDDASGQADSRVEYGLSVTYGEITPRQSGLGAKFVVLEELSPDTTYHFRVRAEDRGGNDKLAPDRSFRTEPVPDTAAPTFGLLQAEPTPVTVKVSWSVLDESDDVESTLRFGPTSSYGTSRGPEPGTGLHTVTLTGLIPETTYHYQVSAVDDAGNSFSSDDQTTTTPPEPDPQVTAIGVPAKTHQSANVGWTLSHVAGVESRLEWGTNEALGSTTDASAGAGEKLVALSGLDADRTYYYRVRATGEFGAVTTTSIQNFRTNPVPDTMPPAISNVANGTPTDDTVVFSWTISDASAVMSQVEYGTTSFEYETPMQSGLGTVRATVSDLAAGATYQFRVRAVDAAGNEAESAVRSFITPPTIFSFTVSNVGASAATFGWEIRDGTDSTQSYVSYGRSPATMTTSPIQFGNGMKSAAASGLVPNNTYTYRVVVIEPGTSSGQSGNGTFLTLPPPPTARLASTAFSNGGSIPQQYACAPGSDASPPLQVSDLHPSATHYALIMDDIDAPGGTFYHWTFWNVPVSAPDLATNADIGSLGGSEGTNDFGVVGYGGPCPPVGENHEYHFRVYALEGTVSPSDTSEEALIAALTGHVLNEGVLMGRYG